MSRITSDPLLTIARVLLVFFKVVMVIAMVGICIGAGAVVVMYPTVLAKLAEQGAPAGAFWAILGMMALSAVLVSAIYRFADLLHQIVATVSEDPFIPANATRLFQMAWLSIGIQVIALPIAGLGVWVSSMIDKTEADIDIGVDFNGLMLALVLFILARVFRRGAEMREELEGTV